MGKLSLRDDLIPLASNELLLGCASMEPVNLIFCLGQQRRKPRGA
jgi:hypothetical protein